MIKYTILYKNGKTWKGKAAKIGDIPIVNCTALFFKQGNVIKVYTPIAGYGIRRWSYRFTLEVNQPRKPNPASVTKKQKKFDEEYVEWVSNKFRRANSFGIPGADCSKQAYKKWLWEQKQVGPDGWITWHGGECPVPGDAKVEVKFRCGETNDRLEAGRWGWWESGGGHIIVAYRLLDEEGKPVKYSEPKKTPIKVTYTFWLGAFGEISDE